MKEVIKKNWDYCLYEKEGKLILSVICGSIALYNVNFELNKSEENSYNEIGQTFLTQLVDMVREKPSMFESRHMDIQIELDNLPKQ